VTRFAVRSVLVGLVAWLVGAPLLSASAQTSGEYTIGVGDQLEVTVWQREDLGATVVVDTEGNITLPLIGAIRAAGQTPARLGEELTRRFSFVDRDVSQVTVAVLNYNSRRVFVMGEVLEPGAYAFAQIPGVWEVIREAGGPTADAALSRVRVIPPDGAGSPRVIDLDQVLATGDFSLLPDLQAGSTILVPRQELIGPEGDVVYVWGSVVDPGPISIDAAPNLVQAILAAGGPADEANIRHVRVVRPGPVRARVFHVDMRNYTEQGKLFTNIDLLPGDTITVPRSNAPRIARFLRDVVAVTAGALGTIVLWRELARN
jgi:polysaccharide export outer membrane protein